MGKLSVSLRDLTELLNAKTILYNAAHGRDYSGGVKFGLMSEIYNLSNGDGAPVSWHAKTHKQGLSGKVVGVDALPCVRSLKKLYDRNYILSLPNCYAISTNEVRLFELIYNRMKLYKTKDQKYLTVPELINSLYGTSNMSERRDIYVMLMRFHFDMLGLLSDDKALNIDTLPEDEKELFQMELVKASKVQF